MLQKSLNYFEIKPSTKSLTDFSMKNFTAEKLNRLFIDSNEWFIEKWCTAFKVV